MKSKILLISFLFVGLVISNAQRSILWGTYGTSKFMHNPGMEYSVPIWKSINLQVGISAYIINFDPNQIANITNTQKFNFLSVNTGLYREVWQKSSHVIGVVIGGIAYHGPHFRILHQTGDPERVIYFDASHLYTRFGLDMGVAYSYDRWSVLVKFDTSRNMLRWGLGYRLGTRSSKKSTN